MTKFMELEAVKAIQAQNTIAAERIKPMRLELSRIELPQLSGEMLEALKHAARRQEREAARTLQQSRDALKRIESEMIASAGAVAVHWRQAIEAQNKQWVGIANGLQQWRREWIRELRESLSEIAQLRPKPFLGAIVNLAEHGWYLDPEMQISLPGFLAKSLGSKDHDEVVARVEEFFAARISAIEQSLARNYPERKHILRDAFEAHEQGKFNLSVPVFLTQADGMFSGDLFTASTRQDAAEKHKSASSEFCQEFFGLFEEPLPIWKTRPQRESSFDGLNRHQVLHGESTDFGKKRYSLQCISLLSFLNWVLNPDQA